MAKAIKSTLKIVRGIEAELPILRVGELGYATDSNTLFVGDPDEGNVKINLNLDRKIILARDFGILGEGKDYSEEITKLLAYLEVNPTDEVVFEPNSIIYTNVSLRVSNTALKGMGTTILPVANSDLFANQKALIILNDNSSADRFILDGNRENNYYYKGEEKRYSGASAVTANVEPKGVSGIWVIGDNCYVTRNTFKDISWSCIDVNGKNKESGRNKNVQVYWNTFYNSAEDHIAMHSCDNVRVYQNYSYDASNHAIHAYSLCSNIQIFNNYIKINKDNVIEWNDGYINASQRTALIIDHPAYPQSQVENTTVKNNIIEGDFVNGVEITGYTENFQIYENKFIGNAGNIGIRFKTVSFGTSFIKRNRFTNVSKAFSINTLSMLGLPTYGVPTVGSVLVEDNYYYDLTTAYEMFAIADIPGIDSFTFTCRNNHYHNVAKSTNIHQMLTNFHLEMYDDLDWETATFNGNTLYERENSIRTKEGPNVNILPYNFDLTDLDGNILGISTRIKYNTGVDTIVTKPEDGLLLITAAGDEMKSFTNVIMRYNLNPLANYDKVTMKTRFTSETDVHFYLLIQALDKNGQKKGQVTVIDTEVIAGEEYSFNNIFNLSTYSFNDPECILNIILQFGIEESYNPFTNFKLMELSMVGGLMYNIPVEYNCYTIQEIYKYIEPLKLYSSDIPTSGTYQLGTTIVNTNPKSGGYIGWVCVKEGTPGVWEGYELNEKAPLIHSHNMSDVSDLQDALNSKVNAVSGKSLVSDTEIARLANVDNYDDTEIRGLIPTKTSQLTNDSNYLTTIPSEYITETELNNKIDETKTEIDNNINEINSQLDDKALKIDLETEKNRIDNLIINSSVGTEKDSELIDGRIGIDGTSFSLIGNNIRVTSKNTNSLITNTFNFKNELIMNLFNKDNVTNDKMIDANGGEVEHSGCTFTNDYLFLKNGESITLNFATYFTIAKYDTSKVFKTNIVVNNEDLPYIFTADSDMYVRFNVYKDNKDLAMVIKGNVLPSKYISYGEKIPYPTELTFNDFQKVYNVINENYTTNLFNKDNVTSGKIIDANGGETTYSTGCYTNDYLLLRKGENITLNFATYLTIPKYDLNKVFKSNIVVNNEDLPYVFTATEDCYVRFNVYSKDKDNAMVAKGKNLPNKYLPFGEYIMTNIITHDRFKNVLSGNYLFVGDSICHGAGATEAGGYAKIIAGYNKDMTHKNIAVSGAILCRRADGDSGSTVLEQIESEAALNNSYNHVILEGGINDIWNMDKYPLGIYDRYNNKSELNENTICGAFESIIRKSKNAWNDAIIYYIIPHLMSAELATPVFDKLIEICKKYAVIVIDLRYLSGEDVTIDYVKKTYTLTNGIGDGVHNNDLGYEKFYVKPIINILSNYQY